MNDGTPAEVRCSTFDWQPENRSGIFRSFFDRSGMCVANVDHAVRVTEANPEFSRQFGRSTSELDGRPFCDLLHPDVRDQAGQQFAGILDGRQAWFSERIVALRPADSSEFTGELTGIAVCDDSGEVEGVMALVRPERGVRKGQSGGGRKASLTDMDARILEGVAAGVSTVQLASMLYLSRGGIEYHVNILLRKLKVNNRPALVSKAYSTGLLCVGAWPPRVHPDYVK
ncbi:MAG: PAS domain-containing protein [Actinoallomurus sp.]